MKEKIDSFLELLKQLSSQNDIQEIRRLEEKIQNLSTDITKELSENTNFKNNEEMIKKIHLLRDSINDLENNNIAYNKKFVEFQNFIKDRKFK